MRFIRDYENVLLRAQLGHSLALIRYELVDGSENHAAAGPVQQLPQMLAPAGLHQRLSGRGCPRSVGTGRKAGHRDRCGRSALPASGSASRDAAPPARRRRAWRNSYRCPACARPRPACLANETVPQLPAIPTALVLECNQPVHGQTLVIGIERSSQYRPQKLSKRLLFPLPPPPMTALSQGAAKGPRVSQFDSCHTSGRS